MQKVLTAAEMREVDRLTTEKYGIPTIVLMENAAHAVVRVITEKLGGSVRGKSFLILCGKGNNGGDGAALARILWDQGGKVQVFLFGKVEDTKGDARVNFEICRKQHFQFGEAFPGSKAGVKYFYFYEVGSSDEFFSKTQLLREDVCVDALFGTGINRRIEGELEPVIRSLNHWQPGGRDSLIVSIDLPSGVNSDSASLFPAKDDDSEARNDPFSSAQADVTVTFTAPKPALILPPAFRQSKELVVADIGSAELVNDAPSQLFLAESRDVWYWLGNTRFTEESYKNKRGHTLIIAGSENYSGAAVLSGNAAIRSGVGLVTIGTPRSSKDSIAGRVVPEVMVRPLAETETGSVAEEAFEEIERFSGNVDAVAIGSGLSASDESTRRLVRRLVKERTMPTVLDADALTLLSPFDANEIKDETKPPLILTPHQGEFLKMLGTKDAESIKDRVAAVRTFAVKHHVILVLKGERNLIAEPGGKVVVTPTANSGLGKAGNGDTLTGILAGFVAQTIQTESFKIDAKFGVRTMADRVFEAAVAAVYIAGLAGDIAEKKFGKRVMTASDVRDCLVEAFDSIGKDFGSKLTAESS